jgi:hypothetical protein
MLHHIRVARAAGSFCSLSVVCTVLAAGLVSLANGASALPAEAPAASTPQSPTRADPLASALASLSPDELEFHQHLVSLTGPFFEGRGPSTRGNQLTAEYVEFFFKKHNLKPAFPDAQALAASLASLDPKPDAAATSAARVAAPKVSYRQAFTAAREVKVNTASLRITTRPGQPGQVGQAGAAQDLVGEQDFTPRGNSGNLSAKGLPVVFVGYAIQDGPEGYRTFGEGDDLSGKVALMLRFEPLTEDGQSRWAGEEGGGFTPRAALNAKIAAVAERKPAAILIVAPPGVDDPRATTLESTRATRQGRVQDAAVVNLSQSAGDAIAKAAGTTLAQLRDQANVSGGISPLAGVQIDLDVSLLREPLMVDNVGAVIPGAGDLADQYVVVGAHLDHLGYGDSGSRAGLAGAGKLHPGADDNASGTAGLLLAARLLASQAMAQDQQAAKDNQPVSRRSFLLLGFNAEESGLIGSRYFVGNAPITADKIDVMLNMDMIGRVRNGRIEVAGVGSAQGFADILQPLWDTSGLTVRTLPGGSGPSDHASFYRASIPVLHFFSGLHPEYHMPSDVYQTVNTQGAVAVTKTVVSVAQHLAQRPEGLTFTTARGPSIDMNMDRQDMEPAAPTPAPTPAPEPTPQPVANPHSGGQPAPSGSGTGTGMGGLRVRFGIAPGDYSGSGGGIEVAEVFPGTPAEQAGIKRGDRIIKWNDAQVSDVEDWMPLLTRASPGDKVVITLVRGGETLTVECVLRARGGGE